MCVSNIHDVVPFNSRHCDQLNIINVNEYDRETSFNNQIDWDWYLAIDPSIKITQTLLFIII